MINKIGQFFVSLSILFKEKVFDFGKITSWDYLTESPEAELRYAILITVVLGLIGAAGIVFQTISNRPYYPRFYKKYLKRIGDFLFYVPLLLILFVIIRILGLDSLNLRIIPVVIIIIWLIWLGYLVYYRIAIVSRRWAEYRALKRREKYIYGSKS